MATRTPRLKVLHVIGTFLNGGTERLMLDILSRLDRQTFDVTACAYDNCELASVVEAYRSSGISTVTFPQNVGLSLVRALAAYIGKNRFDIVHTHHYLGNMYARPAAILARMPIIMTYQHNWPGIERGRHGMAFKFLNRWTHKNITVSEAIRRYDIERIGIDPHKVVTIRNGIDSQLFRPVKPEEVAQARRDLNLPPDASIVGIVGRLNDVKGVDWFLRSASTLHRYGGNVFFVVVGDGELRGSLELLADGLGIGRRTRFLGWRSDVHRAYSAMDVFCMPTGFGGSSFSEGFGLASAEAMSSGLPVVAVDNEVNREVITAACGVFCQPVPEDMAARIAELIDDAALRSRLGTAGRTRAVQQFDIQRTAQQLSDLYLQAVRWDTRVDSLSEKEVRTSPLAVEEE